MLPKNQTRCSKDHHLIPTNLVEHFLYGFNIIHMGIDYFFIFRLLTTMVDTLLDYILLKRSVSAAWLFLHVFLHEFLFMCFFCMTSWLTKQVFSLTWQNWSTRWWLVITMLRLLDNWGLLMHPKNYCIHACVIRPK